jgi:hypothetical protein
LFWDLDCLESIVNLGLDIGVDIDIKKENLLEEVHVMSSLYLDGI